MPSPTLDYYLLPASLLSFQLFIISRQKNKYKKHVVPLKYFDSFCLIEWHQADKRRYCCCCWFMLILACWRNTFSARHAMWGPQKPWDALQHQAQLFVSCFPMTPDESFSLCCKSQWKYLSIYRICLPVDYTSLSSLAMTPHKLPMQKAITLAKNS